MPTARIEVVPETCPARADADARLRAVLAAHRAERVDLVVRVETVPGPDPASTVIQLRVVRASGEVGLDRRFTLAPADCASAAELLALSVDRFLSAFPEWAGPPPPPPPPVVRTRWIDVTLEAAINSIWSPLGVDGQVGVLVDHGAARDRFGGGLLIRGSVPQAAGSGRFQQTALLGAASWRRRAGGWELRAEARAGALLVIGLGFDENDSDWLPWWEGAVFAGRALSWGAIGLEVAATGLQHKAVTRDGLVSEDIPLLRIGLAAEIGVGSQKP
jgi:hypothetical protein